MVSDLALVKMEPSVEEYRRLVPGMSAGLSRGNQSMAILRMPADN